MKNDPHLPTRSTRALTIIEILVIIVVSVVLFGLMMPRFGGTSIRGPQTRALAQAKQIGLALKLYASDHNDAYPTDMGADGKPLADSNAAFRVLFPTYTQSEKIFGNKASSYQTVLPDDLITPPAQLLRPGENVYAYIANLTDADDPAMPLVADGTDRTGAGTYVGDIAAYGGAWRGTKTIVIRLDNSGAVENLTGPANARFVQQTLPDGTKRNLLAPGSLGPKGKLLDPAVTPPPPQGKH